MSRLPSALQPAWPLFKRVHRWLSLLGGIVFRRTSRVAPGRALPHRGTSRAEDTVALEPDVCRLYVGGPAEPLRRTLPTGSPAAPAAFAPMATYDVPRRFTLEIDGGTVVGDYAATVTPGGTLDYETSNYFGIVGWREHPLFLRPWLPEREQFDGTLLTLLVRGGMANYYHFLLDVLPRWGIFQETMPDRVPDALYVPATAGYQRQLLTMAGLDHLPVVPPSKHAAVQARRLLVPSNPNPDLVAPTWVHEWVRRTLPAHPAADAPRRIYVTRGDKPNTRRLVREAETLPLLEKEGFVRVDPGRLTVQEQIDLFAGAEVVVAPHGAGLANLVFCSPGVKVLELFAPNYVNPCYWALTDGIEGSTYRYLVAGKAQVPDRPMNGVLTDIDLPSEAVAVALTELLEAS